MLVALGALVATGGACDGPPAAEAARTPFEQIALDSLVGDSLAFEDLPPRLLPLIDIRQYVAEVALDSLPFASCDELADAAPGERRRRLRLRLPDTSTVVLYAVADREAGTLGRVELIRRLPHAGQRGFIWDADPDRAQSVWWNEPGWSRSRRVERGDVPRSSPIPRALRALGRRLNAMPCAAPDSTR
ncbi:MAG: hypothetical protein WD771_00975 [Gemmatimonadaceae bacterium]